MSAYPYHEVAILAYDDRTVLECQSCPWRRVIKGWSWDGKEIPDDVQPTLQEHLALSPIDREAELAKMTDFSNLLTG